MFNHNPSALGKNFNHEYRSLLGQSGLDEAYSGMHTESINATAKRRIREKKSKMKLKEHHLNQASTILCTALITKHNSNHSDRLQ